MLWQTNGVDIVRNYNQQRREFVLLAMKLIESGKCHHFEVNDGWGCRLYSDRINIYRRVYCYEILNYNDQLHNNEAEIQKLRDLLRSRDE